MDEDLRRAQQATRQLLESLQRSGVETLARAKPVDVEPPRNIAEQQPVAAKDPKADANPDSLFRSDNEVPVLTLDERNEQLKVLNEKVCQCTLCDELATTRTQTVFGVGNPQTRLLLFGEAPGADEDRQGEPFVGRAGQLLDKIIEACTLKRSEIYILNVLKCRPPGNRNPTPEESLNCRPFFEKQIEIIRPEFICCLGSIAAQTLLETKLSIGKLRGRLHPYKWARVLATYHPAYLLRNPSAKKQVWEDMQLLLKEMEIEIPAK